MFYREMRTFRAQTFDNFYWPLDVTVCYCVNDFDFPVAYNEVYFFG